MNNTLTSRERKRLISLYIIVVVTLIGSRIYIGFTSLYHFVILGFFAIAFYYGFNLRRNATAIMIFFILWFLEAIISVIWAPDKVLALQYVYYIFLITALCLLFHSYLTKKTIGSYANFMVVLLFLCNLIAIWEVSTGNHLVKDYLLDSSRERLLKYVPGGFFWNPNDFATFIIQILPFSLVMAAPRKKLISIIALFNVVASFFTVAATQSRTQIILIIAIYVCFVLFTKKIKLLKSAGVLLISILIIYLVYPDFNDLVNAALESICGEQIRYTAEEGSLATRISLLKNGMFILLDTFGFGIGAGCHRVVMSEYSARYYPTDGTLVMHNLVGELFVDYGLLIGFLFLVALVISIFKLYSIYKTSPDEQTRNLSILLAFILIVFIPCGVSSSSIIQLTSVWVTFCFISAFIKAHTVENSKVESRLSLRCRRSV